MKFCKSDKIIFLLALIYSIPFILNAELFKDDLYRAASGDPGYWDKDSRPLTTILMKALNLGHTITDLSPLSFMIAMACMVLSAMIISRVLSNESPNSTSAFCASFIFLNPMFVGNAAFAFDSATMGLSIAISIASAYVFTKYKYIDFLWKSIAITCVMSLYQPSSSLFVALTALLVVIEIINNDKPSLKIVFVNAASFVFGFILYTKIVQTYYPPTDYAKRNAQLIDFHYGFIDAIKDAFARNIDPIALSMPGIVKIAFIVTIAISLMFVAKIAISKGMSNLDKTLLIGSYIFSLLMFSGFSIVVNSDYVMPRVLMSLGLTLSLIFYTALKVNRLRYVTCISLLIFTINSINIPYAFNNAIKHQNNYDDKLLTSVFTAIHLSGVKSIDNLNVAGWPPVSPPTQVIYDKYPYFKTIIPQYLSNAWGIGAITPYFNATFRNIYFNNEIMMEGVKSNGDNIFTSCLINVFRHKNDILLDFTSKCQ
ncbi:TPA: glucosyltransferase domain-containing protein [Enterobacter hormaechei]|nr:glucosyltransferase domain-containing protein [Enterobacter hormaechei]